jgi:hypothetical protein
MKTKRVIFSLIIMICFSIWIAPQRIAAQPGSVSFQVFYDDLSPYGTWVDNPDYGYVWYPNVGPGFTPYATNGYWVLTDAGWTWVSNYPWGWAPFHYGRWYTDPMYGAMWIPDNEWGPGWVTWRRCDGYYGWAPIGPGVSISIAYSNGYNVPSNQWRFVRDRDFGRRDINNYYINTTNNITIINKSTVINNTQVDRARNVTYNAGPARAEVEKVGGRKITPVAIKESNKPGQSLNQNQLQIYRPQVQKSVSSGQKPAPAKVESIKNVKPAAQRNSGAPQPKTTQPAKQPSQQPASKDVKQQAPKQQPNAQPAKQQQEPKQQHQAQPPKQQAPKQQHNAQPAKQQQHQAQPPKQQQSQPQQKSEPPHEQTNPPKKDAQPQSSGEENKEPPKKLHSSTR